MPNLVGIGNSQVPTNAMLGGLAYQDSVGEIDIDKIKARTEDTARDIFVYDTSKDSDGGAWRKRTQNTSWYNESASSTRGARKEFPTVAIIVVESYQVTIYDADDPNCPMWMVFNQSTTELGAMVGYSNMTIGCCTMLNGILMVGLDHTSQGNVSGLRLINFISEHHHWKANISGRHSSQHWPIVDRNGGRNNVNVDSNFIVNEFINDVDAIVLADAPIDRSTGLPIPTIVIATNGGISVIRDNGVVYDLTTNNEPSAVAEIAFLADTRYSFATTGNNSRWTVDDIQTADENHNYFYQRTSFDYQSGGQGSVNALGRVNGTSRGEVGEAIFRQASGMSRIRYEDTLINFTTTDFNTGWTAGDAEGILLSSTDDTNITGSGDGYVTGNDSTFGAAITSLNWSERSGSSGRWNVSGGTLNTGNPGVYDAGEYLDITLPSYTSGQTHVISYTLSSVSGYKPLRWRYNDGQMGDLPTSNGFHAYYVTLTETGTKFSILNDNNLVASIDNFKIQLISDDNRTTTDGNKGLHAYGTITKTAVAPGAELVAYSGFTSGNFLEMHSGVLGSNTSVNGPLTVSCWFKGTTNGAPQTLIMIGPSVNYNARGLLINSSGYLGFFRWSGDPFSTTVVTDNQWHHCAATLDSSSTVKLYVDGELVYNQSITLATSSSTQVRIGYSNGNNAPLTNGSLALCKISNDVADAEAIKKTYNDEKYLFRDNAKCTLYGTSNSVTALAYDDTKNILHAGTSSGRSEFRGLTRINNTTTAVTTAISASDGLVAEQ